MIPIARADGCLGCVAEFKIVFSGTLATRSALTADNSWPIPWPVLAPIPRFFPIRPTIFALNTSLASSLFPKSFNRAMVFHQSTNSKQAARVGRDR
jgi:hypothetical protein